MSDWQLDRLPGDVRQEAENAAQREGMPLHRWLGKLIHETCAEEGVPPGRELLRGAAAAAPRNGNGHQPVATARPPVEPIRAASPAADEPIRVPAPPPRPAPGIAVGLAPGNGSQRPLAADRNDPAAAAPDARSAPRLRAAPLAREAKPAEPFLAPAPSPLPRFSSISTLSTTPLSAPATASRAMPQPRPSAKPPALSGLAPEPSPVPPRPAAATPKPAPATADTSVPSALRADDRLAALSKLVQNLRRNELSPIGEARLFLKLMTEHMASIGDITVATGRTREQVSRSLRLLGLSDRLRDLIDRGALSREQAFALLDADDPDVANPVVPPNTGHRAS